MATSEIGELQVLITAQADKFNAEIAKVQNQIQAMSASTNKLSAKTIALGGILGTVATKAFGKLVSVVRESDLAYRSASQSLTKLATIMQQRGATQAQYDEIVKLTEAEEKLGVISNDAMQNGLQELATYVGKAESLKKLTNVMNNLVVQQHGYDASSYNVLQTATMMGKVLQGQTGGMERIGYHLTEGEKALFNFGTEEERVALLTDIVNNNLGDLNHRLGETNVGRQIQLANTWAQLRAQVGELASAVGNILIPVFSAVANAVGRAIAYIKAFLGLFGIKTANAASQTASNVSNAADAVGDYGDAATGAAKKVKKSLAAFDEMNVLMEDTSSGSGGGGGSDGFDILEDLEASALQIDWGSLIPDIELPDWLKNLGNLFSDIDIEKIRTAFATLWEDIKAGAQPVIGVLSDLWNDYFKPLVTWTGNELLPAFLNALGGAIQFVGQAIGTVWEVALKPFIDSFLVPIAQWTGGVVVNVLNAIGDGLRDIAKNKKLMETIAKGLTAVGSALAVAKVVKFFDAFADGIKIFKTVSSATGSIVEAFSAVASNTTGITQVLSNLGGNIAQTVSNGLNLLKTGFSSLWSVISAHPIAAIVTALSALLLTNENFRESLGKLLNAILSPLMELLGRLGGVIGEIVNTLTSVISSILEPIGAVIQIIAEVLSIVVGCVADFIGLGLEMALQPILVVLELIKPALEFIKGLIEALLAPLKWLFGWLGNLFGITNDNKGATEEYNSKLSEEKEQFDRNKDGALDLAESLNYLASVQNGVNKAEEDMIHAEQTLTEKTGILQQYADKYGKTVDELIGLHKKGQLETLASGEELQNLKLATIDVEKATYNLNTASQKYEDEQGKLQSEANQTKEEYDRVGQEMLTMAETVGFVDGVFDEQAQKLQDLQTEIEATGKNVGEMRNWYQEALDAGMRLGEGLTDGYQCMVPEAQRVGQNLPLGMIQGSDWMQSALYNAGKRDSQTYLRGAKAGADEHSPSKATRQIGRFLGEGLILGVQDEENKVEQTAKDLSQTVIDSLAPISDGLLFDFASTDISGMIRASGGIELDMKEDKEPVHVTVNVGEDTLVNKIVDGINEMSYLNNRAVINV